MSNRMHLREYDPVKISEMLKTMKQAQIAKEFRKSRQRINQICKTFEKAYPELFQKKDLSEQELKEALNKHKSITDIVKATGVSRHRILTGMKKYGLKRIYYADILTKDILHDRFIVKGMSDSKIAEEFNCSVNTVEQLRKQFDIRAEMREPKPAVRLSESEFRELYYKKGLTLSQIADLVDISICTLIKEKTKYDVVKKRKRYRAPGISEAEFRALKKEWEERA